MAGRSAEEWVRVLFPCRAKARSATSADSVRDTGGIRLSPLLECVGFIPVSVLTYGEAGNMTKSGLVSTGRPRHVGMSVVGGRGIS